MHKPDEGEIFIGGKKARIESPMDALAAGIETIYQDLALAENLDVGANIFLGRERMRRSLGVLKVLDDQSMREEAQKVLDRLDIDIPSLKKTIRTLSGGQRQAVAISRSIYWDAKVLIMDEPTAALGVAEQKKVLEPRADPQGPGHRHHHHQPPDVRRLRGRRQARGDAPGRQGRRADRQGHDARRGRRAS